MSDMCPQCGSGVRRDVTVDGGLQRQRWLCGSFETDLNVRRSATCYERELSAKKAVISAMTAQIENLQKFKSYTHERLALLGAPEVNHRSPHTEAGCRVGVQLELAAPNKTRDTDIDNRIKATLDALQGLLFVNDGQIDQLIVRRLPIAKPGYCDVIVSELDQE